MPGYPSERLRICNNVHCLAEFVSKSRKVFYCPECNKKRYQADRKRRHEKNRERDLAQYREYYAAHKDKILARTSKYEKEHPEAHRASARRYKERQRAALGKTITVNTVTKNQIRAIATQVSSRTINEIPSAQIQANLKTWEENGEMRYCERMRLKARTLPCGQRGECYHGKKCDLAPERKPRKYIDLMWS